jgi:peptidyl-prolyl cis-trans isomerase SurA
MRTVLHRASLAAFAMALCVSTTTRPAAGQDPAGAFDPNRLELIDRVLAIAGDSVILQSELRDAIDQLRQQGAQFPADSAEMDAVERNLLDRMIDQLLMVQAAAGDTLLAVEDADVEPRVDARMAELRTGFPDEGAFLSALAEYGYTEAGYRELLSVQIRKELLIQSYEQSRSREALTAPVSDAEVLESFENDPRPPRPETFKFLTIFIQEAATDSAWAAAEAEALAILRRIVEGGEDFKVLAKELSEDPASAANEGSVEWIRLTSRFVDEFKDAAFDLPEGAVSPPVRSAHGYHLIRVDRIRGPERLVRHILIRPETSDADVERTRARAEEALTRARAGEPFRELQREYGDTITADTITIARAGLEQSPFFSVYLPAMEAGEVGDVLGIIEGPGQQPESVAFSVLEYIEHRASGPWELEEIREQLRQELVSEKIRETLVRDLRALMHVEVRWVG